MNTCETCTFWTREKPLWKTVRKLTSSYCGPKGLVEAEITDYDPNEKSNQYYDVISCTEIKHNFGKCSSPYMVFNDIWNKDYPGHKYLNPCDCLVYWDADDYKASFATGKDFGCIHHKVKNE